MDNKRLFSVIFVVFLDLLGFGLILPLLPYYAETFAASEFTTGLLVASYAAMQLIGAAFGIGFIIGPVTGGFLSQWGYAFPAFLARRCLPCSVSMSGASFTITRSLPRFAPNLPAQLQAWRTKP